jgi:hemerythrin-like domain-containing protein
MSKQDSPNVIVGMLSIHAVITRALEVAVDKCDAFSREDPSDASLREGFVSYLQCLISLLNVHHQTEDLLAFPRFQKAVEAPYDLLEEQHRLLHPLLEEAKAEVERAAAGPNTAERWGKLKTVLNGVLELWRPHIAIEEEHFTVDRFAVLMPPEEHIRLSAMFMEHTQQHTGPDYLMVPFLLHNLPKEKRSFFAGEMPPIVTQQLLPGAWKEKWAPMQPFLLE